MYTNFAEYDAARRGAKLEDALGHLYDAAADGFSGLERADHDEWLRLYSAAEKLLLNRRGEIARNQPAPAEAGASC